MKKMRPFLTAIKKLTFLALSLQMQELQVGVISGLEQVKIWLFIKKTLQLLMVLKKLVAGSREMICT